MASVTWLGQMGLRIRMGDTTILVDYFASDLPGRRVRFSIDPPAVDTRRWHSGGKTTAHQRQRWSAISAQLHQQYDLSGSG